MTNSKRWKKIHTLEDALAYIAVLNDLQRVIRLQAWNESDWDAVFDAATKQRRELAELKALLSARWYEIMEDK